MHVPVAIAALCFILLGVVCPAVDAHASDLTKLEIEAGKQAMAGNFPSAIGIYGQILAADGTKSDIYIQRALLFRELGDTSSSMRDAAIALELINRKFADGRRVKASLYRQRANAYRLLKKFPEAKADMEMAIQQSRSNKWVPDLQAIYLEEKMYSRK